VARRAVNLHGCVPASRASIPLEPGIRVQLRRLEGRASFVARRAMNLHGCALPHSALPPAAAPLDPLSVHGLFGNGTLEAGLTLPPVLPTEGVPQGV